MKKTSRSETLLRMPTRSSFFCNTGPEVCCNPTPNSLAMIEASVVFPNPGGPYSNTWSIASPRCRAASIAIARFSFTFACPAKSASRCGRSVTSNCRSPSSNAPDAIPFSRMMF
ncbi:MAG: hypothetical protein JW395_1326 [Nitrospira sp.]|nr:hypothetical protein [Nitrospira sp.]